MTVVGLHGFAGAPTQWQGIADVTPWLPGHGPRAPEPDFDAAVRALAADVEPGALLAGYSLGARLALALALAEPHRVRGLLLVGGSPGIEDPGQRARRRAWDDAQAAAIEGDLLAWVETWEQLPIFAGQTEELVAAQRDVRAGHDPAFLAASMRSLGQGRMPPQWSELHRCPPMHLVVGGRDRKYVDLAERMAAKAQSAELTVIPGVGHNVLLEAPEAVRRIVA